MNYEHKFIPPAAIPATADPMFQHIVDTYAGEINKTAGVWLQFSDGDMEWKPHTKSSRVREIMHHQLLSERRFFAEFLGNPQEADVSFILPEEPGVAALGERFIQLATPRLGWLASLTQFQWMEKRRFFDEERERIWIFWRRVLHTAHHRTQLTVYLRLLNKTVPATYGPTADVTWEGADPTTTLEAARRQTR